MTVAIIVPSLVRADRLEKCLESICEHVPQAHVRVFNNWTHSGVAKVCAHFEAASNGSHKFTIHSHPENLGCAGSWNLGLKKFFEEGHDWVVVMNDDVRVRKGAIESLKECLDSGADLAWSSESMACFGIKKSTLDAVGWFDENFWPAYHEDEDFAHRMRLAGLKPSGAAGAVVDHDRSSSLNYSDLMWFKHRMKTDHQNLLYYGRKWGGVPNFEKFTRPFNDSKCELSYWPEPLEHNWGLKLDDNDRVVLKQDRPFSVRLYGTFHANASFARVSKGLLEGFQDLGLLAGAVELDAFDSDEIASAEGADATVGLYSGNPSFISVMASQGRHDMNFAIVAPNSSWLPEALVQSIRERAAVIAPSSWGADVLACAGAPPYAPLRHGVMKAFVADRSLADRMVQSYDAGEFRVLHLSSTHRARKGTAELVSAWKRLCKRNMLGKNPKLVAIVDAPRGLYSEADGEPTIVFSDQRLDASEAQMAVVYQHFHLVCQPSRGEGFGMVPLEARACGVPVVATACAGHLDHMGGEQDGCVVVKTGAPTTIDDGPGAMAPSLRSEDVEAALEHAYARWKELHQAAQRNADRVRSEWSWANQINNWLTEMGLHKGD